MGNPIASPKLRVQGVPCLVLCHLPLPPHTPHPLPYPHAHPHARPAHLSLSKGPHLPRRSPATPLGVGAEPAPAKAGGSPPCPALFPFVGLRRSPRDAVGPPTTPRPAHTTCSPFPTVSTPPSRALGPSSGPCLADTPCFPLSTCPSRLKPNLRRVSSGTGRRKIAHTPFSSIQTQPSAPACGGCRACPARRSHPALAAATPRLCGCRACPACPCCHAVTPTSPRCGCRACPAAVTPATLRTPFRRE